MKANVYTALAGLALVALIATCIIVGKANLTMTSDLQPSGQAKNPFYVIPN